MLGVSLEKDNTEIRGKGRGGNDMEGLIMSFVKGSREFVFKKGHGNLFEWVLEVMLKDAKMQGLESGLTECSLGI